MRNQDLPVRAALLGAASGLRTTAGLAAFAGMPPATGSIFQRRRGARCLALFSAGGELVADKLPSTGSRLEPAGLVGRLVFAGLGAAVLARSAPGSKIPSVAIAATAALGMAKLGHDGRAALSKRYPALLVALGEDALALGLAVFACR